MSNVLKLNLTITFTGDADVTDRDTKIIIDNVIEALRSQVNSGSGIAPEEPEKYDYITEFIDIRDSKGVGYTFDLFQDKKLKD